MADARRTTAPAKRRRVTVVTLAAVVAVVVAGVGVGLASMSAQASTQQRIDGQPVKTLTLTMPHPYKPVFTDGSTDDYHCILLNPHVTNNSYVVASEFHPGSGPSSVEVHHAILFLVPPNEAAAAQANNPGDKGWSCFGESPLDGNSLAGLGYFPWLSAWAPGAGLDTEPLTTGTPLPAGSMVIMQVHFNGLVGDKPVQPWLQLKTVPASAHLRPETQTIDIAPPDYGCPTGVTGPLCSRPAAMNYLGQRFGEGAVLFDDTIESLCGRNPVDPPTSDTTQCTWPIYRPEYVVRLTAHMHLTGASMRVILNPGTPTQKTLLNVPDFNFHYQRGYDLAHWVKVVPGDKIQVSCTYNPDLRQQLPQLRKLPPRYVVWGDGSSDEMCLSLISTVPINPDAPTDWTDQGGMAWHAARYGADAWNDLVRIDKSDWMRYLVWFRRTLNIPVRNATRVVDITPAGALWSLHLETPHGPETILTREVVLATGLEGGGARRIPDLVADLARETWAHAADPIDFGTLRGRRVAVIGGGSSAYDNAAEALEHGARRVDMFIRRASVPMINPYRAVESAGFWRNFPDLDDATRFRFMHRLFSLPMPPPQDSVDRVTRHDNVAIHFATPVLDAARGPRLRIPSGWHGADFVILATGFGADLRDRPEFRSIHPAIATWADRYEAPADALSEEMGRHPYVGSGFELLEKVPGKMPGLGRIRMFNAGSKVSTGPISTGLNGMPFGLPRLIHHISRDFLRDQAAAQLHEFETYEEPDAWEAVRTDGNEPP